MLTRRACVRWTGIAALIAGLLVVVGLIAASAVPASACGGLVGENGTIQLVRTTTLSAYHDGVERYVTSFEFDGKGKSLGSIVPLPDVPSKVERAGDWTLQRLQREIAPPVPEAAGASLDAKSSSRVEVILQKKIDALDITILRGGGSQVGKWATDNGFLLTPDAPEMLDFYASRSPVFMAAKFDASRAAKLDQTTGQGTPIMLTIPTSEPWVPLHILSLGIKKAEVVQADVFLLTDEKPKLLAGGRGLSVGRSERASTPLLDDLRRDKGMNWVPKQMWLSYLKVDAQARDLDYDLAVSAHKDTLPSIEAAGIPVPETRTIDVPAKGRELWPITLGLGFGAVALALVRFVSRRRHEPAPIERV